MRIVMTRMEVKMVEVERKKEKAKSKSRSQRNNLQRRSVEDK